MNLDGDHLSDDFIAINPLQRIPVIIDNGFRIVESLAILIQSALAECKL